MPWKISPASSNNTFCDNSVEYEFVKLVKEDGSDISNLVARNGGDGTISCEISRLGGDILSVDGNNQADFQFDQIEDLISQDYDVLAINLVDRSEAATVIASGTLAGESLQASFPELPAAIAKTVPALIMAALIWALLAIGFQSGWFTIIDTNENVFNFFRLIHLIYVR